MPHRLELARFVLAAHRLAQLPPDAGAEVAFAGRSNAGKSSALNALTGRRGLARTSRTPGRTQQMVVFELPDAAGAGARLVDLPGYGYASVPVALREHWRREIDAYLRRRRSLRGVVLLIDIRHPLKDFDRTMLAFCAAAGLPCHVLLTKADKLSRSQAAQALAALRRQFAADGFTAHPQVFSAHTGEGVAEARQAVLALLGDDASPPAP
ncbi:ribosome biogenesis GTP-binding protein YihA/YsxC [Aerosticca soli]|uniref:ribosome biogenesis GTP-binding protein YihA/YsxC n=1 Tax=Aerosticca soli TaxID=2010829 RepID=UPI000F820C4D|nr:ribosome biogenesis GTP-binding protein YihA/YsxC [Aerosticca soli]